MFCLRNEIFYHFQDKPDFLCYNINPAIGSGNLAKGVFTMDKNRTISKDVAANQVSSKIVYAADMFSRLSPDAQKAIIDLIKSLLSEK